MHKDTIPNYMTISQAAEQGQFSEASIRKAILDGNLPASKPLARDVRIRAEDFRLWMAKGYAPAKEKQLDRGAYRQELESQLINYEPSLDELGREEWVWQNLSGLHQENPHTGPILVCKYPPTLQFFLSEKVAGPFSTIGANVTTMFENVPTAPDEGHGTAVLEVSGKVKAVFGKGWTRRRGRMLAVVGQDHDPRANREVVADLEISQEDADKLFELATQKSKEVARVQGHRIWGCKKGYAEQVLAMASFVVGALSMVDNPGNVYTDKERQICQIIRDCSDLVTEGTFEDVVLNALEQNHLDLSEEKNSEIRMAVQVIEQRHRLA